MRFFEVLNQVIGMLVRERRVTYRALKREFDLDNAFIEDLREELIFAKQVAIDDSGKVLVWTGGPDHTAQPTPITQPLSTLQDPTTTMSSGWPPLLPLETESQTQSNAPTAPLEAALTDVPTEVSPGIATRHVQEAERRQLTVMFCDLVGSTDLSGKLDPEDLREVVRSYQETAAQVIQRFEGHIAQYLGDGLLVYFGYPLAHEDDAQRAVHTGLGILDAMVTLNSQLGANYNIQLAVRLGIHTGAVVVGEMGGGDRHEQLALGETPNIASRLEGLAAPNTIIMSAVTAGLVRHAFAFEELGLQDLRGVATPMAAARVIGLRDAHDNSADTEPGKAVLLVGRDEEIGLLLRRWSQSAEGLGQVVLISGEAGIGKSSLIQTVGNQVTHEGATRITVRCSPYHSNSALHPVITHLQRVMRWHKDMTAEFRLDALERFLLDLTLPTTEMVPLLAALLEVPVPETLYTPLTLSPQQQRQQTHDALVACLMAEAERKPVLVVWEDLHWADPSTLEMLGVLIDQSPTVPMLQILTFRPEFTPSWPTRSHMTPITLNRLERPQVEAMITHLVNNKSLPREVVEHIVTKTDGVPLFVEELTKMLLEATLLSDEGDQYVLTGPLSSVAIPATLRDSLMARLDRLPTVRVVAQLGAVLGREFDYEMLHALAGVEETTLQEGLGQLVEAELLYQRGRPPRARYIFKHALVQDAAYSSLLRSTRQQYHQQVAQLLEARFPETVTTQPELAAHHYTEAGCPEQAIVYWQQAGQRVQSRSANIEAIAHFTNGLALIQALPDTEERDQQELTLRLGLAIAFSTTQGWASPDAEVAYNRARELCQQLGNTEPLPLILWGLGNVAQVRAEPRKARGFSEELLRLTPRQQDSVYLMAAHQMLAGAAFGLGEFALSQEHFEQVTRHDDRPRHHAHIAQVGVDLDVFSQAWATHPQWLLGYPEQAQRQSHKTRILAQGLSHPLSATVALAYAAMLHQFSRDVKATQELAEATITLCTENGFAYYLAWATIIQGWVIVVQGQGETGIAQIHQGIEAIQATGGKRSLQYYYALLAEAYGNVGQVKEGLGALDAAFAEIEHTQECWWEAELYRLKGELVRQSAIDNPMEAETYFQQALDIARRQQAKALELRAATSLSRLLQQQGEDEKARNLLSETYNWFTEGFDTADLQEAKALLQELA